MLAKIQTFHFYYHRRISYTQVLVYSCRKQHWDPFTANAYLTHLLSSLPCTQQAVNTAMQKGQNWFISLQPRTLYHKEGMLVLQPWGPEGSQHEAGGYAQRALLLPDPWGLTGVAFMTKGKWKPVTRWDASAAHRRQIHAFTLCFL